MAEGVLWAVDELVAATAGQIVGLPRQALTGISIDTRTLAPGDIFVAIKGEKLDGHDFVPVALAAGAGLAVVSRETDAMRVAGPLLIVKDDPLRGLEAIGQAARARSLARIVGVTGSVGKTSTKEMLRVALSASGMTHASSASHNNHWGVPLTLARMPREAAYGVFEIGMNHAGEIAPLTAMVRPHVAIVTAIAESHLGHFDSLDGIADAKAEIFSGVVSGGAAVINRDTPYFDRLAKAARSCGIDRIFGFGKSTAAEARIVRVALHDECSCVTAIVLGEEIIYKLGVPGEHMAMNSLAVLAAARLVGADLARAALALAVAAPTKGRGARQRLMANGGEILLIDESYNANPASVAAALQLLAQARPGKGGRRIAVLGDMLELGEHGPRLHADLAEAVDAAAVDTLYAAGPLMAQLWERLPAARRGAYAETAEGIRETVLSEVGPGDVVMVKGSLGSRMGPIAEEIRTRFAPVKKDI